MMIAGFCADILICFFIPLLGIGYCCKKKKQCLRAALVGILCFVISQVVIRIPLLTMVLPDFAWFQMMQFYPWINGLFLGITAALAEESARWFFMKYFLMKKKRNSEKEEINALSLEGLAFGLGHGGIEAILFVGINAIASVILGIAGTYPFTVVNATEVWMGGIERIFAMAFHVGASLLVMYGLCIKKELLYVFLAGILHTVLDAAIVILPAVFSVGMLGVEIWCAVFGSVTLAVGIFIFRKRPMQ